MLICIQPWKLYAIWCLAVFSNASKVVKLLILFIDHGNYMVASSLFFSGNLTQGRGFECRVCKVGVVGRQVKIWNSEMTLCYEENCLLFLYMFYALQMFHINSIYKLVPIIESWLVLFDCLMAIRLFNFFSHWMMLRFNILVVRSTFLN